MVKVCCCCSKVNVEALKEIVPADQLHVGCIDQCQGFDGQSFGIIKDELVTADGSEAFIEKVKQAL